MNVVDGKCPNCGANIKVDSEKDAAICEYCGAAYVTAKAIVKINAKNVTINAEKYEHKEYHNNTHNEYHAKSAMAELIDGINKRASENQRFAHDNSPVAEARRIREHEERERSDKANTRMMLLLLGTMMLILFALFGFMARREYNANMNGFIKVENWNSFIGKDHEIAEDYFRTLGFENIKAIDLDDASLFKKDGTVESIEFPDGDDMGNLVSPIYLNEDTTIIITYH